MSKRTKRRASPAALQEPLPQPQPGPGEQEWRSGKLEEILRLSAELARLQDEESLLTSAVTDIQDLLGLQEVSIYAWQHVQEGWHLRATTGPAAPGAAPPPAVMELLRHINTGKESARGGPAGSPTLRASRLSVGRHTLGALVTSCDNTASGLFLLLNAFAASLAAHWRNLQLYAEARERTRELEILHGRYVDDIWHSPGGRLRAHFSGDRLHIEREVAPVEPPTTAGSEFPLMLGEHTLGKVRVPAGTSLATEEAGFLQALVQEMGSALNNARLIQATRSYSLQLQTAAEVSRAMSTVLDQATLMAEVVDLIQRRFEFHYVGLFLLDSETAVLRAGSGEVGEKLISQSYSLEVDDQTVPGRALITGRAAVERDLRGAVTRLLPETLAATRAQLALPLRARGTIIGALDVHSRRAGAFTPEELTVLQSLAEQVAVAIDNASLFAQVQDNYLRVNQLYLAGRRINEAAGSDEIFQALVDYAATSKQADLAFVLTPDPQSANHLVAANFWNSLGHEEDPERDRLLRPYFPAADQLRNNRELIVADGQNEHTFDRHTRELFRRFGVRGAAFLPVYSEGEWLASLVLCRAEAHRYTPQTLQPFLSLCGQAGVALANQLLLRETNALYQMSRILTQVLTAEEALETILEQVSLYTGIAPCRAVLYDEHATRGTVAFIYPPAAADGESQNNDFTLPAAGDVLYEHFSEAREPLVVTPENAPQLGAAAAYLEHFNLDAALLVPIFVQQRLAGFLALDSASATRPFTPNNRNFAENAVAQLTTFLENISLFEEAQQQAQTLIRLNQIAARLSGTLEMEQLLHVLYEEVRDLLPADVFLLLQRDPERRSYRSLSYIVDGEPQPVLSRPELPADSPWREQFSSQLPVTGEAALELARALGPAGEHPVQSALWIAMPEEHLPGGFFSVQSFAPDAYSERDVHRFRALATQAGLALTNARLFRQTQENVAEFRMLFTVSQAAAASVEASKRLEKMATALHDGMSDASIVVYALNPAGTHVQVVASAGSLLPAGPVDLYTGLSGQVLRLGQPLVVHDLQELPAYQAELPAARSQLSVPLSMGQRTIGVLTAASETPHRFSERDLRLLETLSVGFAATLESTRLFENIQATNERLRELDRLKTRFLANMTHELRTPLNAIIGFSRVILKGIDGPITPEQEEDLNSIYESGQHLLVLINDILDLAKIEAGKVTLIFEPVDLGELLDSVLGTVRGLLEDRPVALKLDVPAGLPPIEGDEVRLRQIMLNLLANAARYTDAGHIRCHIRPEGEEYVQISVSDTGRGIAKEDYKRLFRAFEQADSTTRTGQGTGLGLPISKSLVEMHNGKIWFDSELGKGSTFYVRLPVRQPEDE